MQVAILEVLANLPQNILLPQSDKYKIARKKCIQSTQKEICLYDITNQVVVVEQAKLQELGSRSNLRRERILDRQAKFNLALEVMNFYVNPSQTLPGLIGSSVLLRLSEKSKIQDFEPMPNSIKVFLRQQQTDIDYAQSYLLDTAWLV